MAVESQFANEGQRATGWERAFAVVFIVLLTGAFLNLFLTPEQQLDPSEGLPAMRYLWAAIYLGVLILLRQHCKGSLALLLRERALLLLTALAILSAIWSDAPTTTLRRSVALAGTLAMALYFSWRFKIREQVQILVWVFAACAAFSFFFGLFHLGRPVDEMEGAWYGVYTQRNELGTMMVFGALTFLIWSRMPSTSKWIGWVLAAGAFGLVVLSGSITSLVAFGVLLSTIPMVWLIRRYERTGRFLILAGVLLIGMGWWVGTSFDAVTEAMGRDSSLTGRTELWGASILFGLNRPLLGYGYNAFWLGLEGQSADVWQIVGWAAPSAHNGLLEIWLDLGLAGVAIVVYSFGSSLRRAFEAVRDTTNWQYAWPLLFLVILFVMNLTESTFFEGNSIYWFLYMVTAMNLTLLDQRRRENSPALLTGANP
jgi:exopolysaccharide production protein ExoQ